MPWRESWGGSPRRNRRRRYERACLVQRFPAYRKLDEGATLPVPFRSFAWHQYHRLPMFNVHTLEVGSTNYLSSSLYLICLCGAGVRFAQGLRSRCFQQARARAHSEVRCVRSKAFLFCLFLVCLLLFCWCVRHYNHIRVLGLPPKSRAKSQSRANYWCWLIHSWNRSSIPTL